MSFEFKPNAVLDVLVNQPKHFIIIGAGGNGGYLIRDFLRQVSIQNRRLSLSGLPGHEVTVIDADVVLG